jgi:hypothetical protein
VDGIRPGHFRDSGRRENQPYPIDPSRPLCDRPERPCGSNAAAEESDEFAPLQSIELHSVPYQPGSN